MTFSTARLKKLKSTIAGATASVFLFTTVSVPVVEANFWQDRQKAARTVAEPSAADAGTAESRSLYAGMFKGANPMLLDEKAVDGVAAGARDLVTKGLADLVTPRTTDQKPLPAWMRTLVTPFGEIEDFHVTGALQKAATWSFDKSADPVIVLLQDVHNVPEAQLNISKIMESYQTRAGLSVVGLEGATGGLLTDRFRAMNAPEALRWASDFLINERVLSGAEYFGLNAPASATLWGIEDEAAYLANVEAYKQTVALRPVVAAFEASAEGALAALQDKVYSADLKIFERQRSLYADEKIPLSDYVESIAAGPALRAGINLNTYPNIALFRKAILLEKTIDFKKVEAERNEFLRSLTGRLSKDDLTRLVALSMEFRLHHVGFGDYYKALSAAAQRVKVDLAHTPELKKYVSYALLTDGIARTSFLNEIGRLEDSVTEGLATSSAQKEAARLSRDHVLLGKLLHHNLTYRDWSAYQKRANDLRAFAARLAAAGQKSGVAVPKAEFGFSLAPYETFYATAQARNDHFVQNLFERLRASGAKSAVLVAGGFHTEGLRDLLTQKGIGHVVVTPRLTKVDKDDNYLDVFVRDHTPLEKMMLGEKLFIRNTLGLAENAPAGFAGVHDSVTRGLSVLAFAAVLALGAATPRDAAAAAKSDAAQRALAAAPVPLAVTSIEGTTVNLTAGDAPLALDFSAAETPPVPAPGRINAGTAGNLSVTVTAGPAQVLAGGWWDSLQKWFEDLRSVEKKPAAASVVPRFQDFLYQANPGVEAQRVLSDNVVRALLVGIPRESLPAFYDLLKKDAFLNGTNLPPAFALVQARIWQVFREGPVRLGSKEIDGGPRHPVMVEVQNSLLRSAEQNARNPRYSITAQLDTPDNNLYEAQRILADATLLDMLNKLTPDQVDAVATAPGNGAFLGSPRRQLYGTPLGDVIDRVSYLFEHGPFARGGLDARQRDAVVQLVEKKLAEAAKTAVAARTISAPGGRPSLRAPALVSFLLGGKRPETAGPAALPAIVGGRGFLGGSVPVLTRSLKIAAVVSVLFFAPAAYAAGGGLIPELLNLYSAARGLGALLLGGAAVAAFSMMKARWSLAARVIDIARGNFRPAEEGPPLPSFSPTTVVFFPAAAREKVLATKITGRTILLRNGAGREIALTRVRLGNHAALRIGNQTYLMRDVKEARDGEFAGFIDEIRLDALNPLGNPAVMEFFGLNVTDLNLEDLDFTLPVDPAVTHRPLTLIPVNPLQQPGLRADDPPAAVVDAALSTVRDALAQSIGGRPMEVTPELIESLAVAGLAKDPHAYQDVQELLHNLRLVNEDPVVGRVLAGLANQIYFSHTGVDWLRYLREGQALREAHDLAAAAGGAAAPQRTKSFYERPVPESRVGKQGLWTVSNVKLLTREEIRPLAVDPTSPEFQLGRESIQRGGVLSLLLAGGSSNTVKKAMGYNKMVHRALHVLVRLANGQLATRWISIVQGRLGFLFGQSPDAKVGVIVSVGSPFPGESSRSILPIVAEEHGERLEKGQIRVYTQRVQPALNSQTGYALRYSNGDVVTAAENHLWAFLSPLMDQVAMIDFLEKSDGVAVVGNGDNVLNFPREGMVGEILKARSEGRPLATVAMVTETDNDRKVGLAVSETYVNNETGETVSRRVLREASEFPVRKNSPWDGIKLGPTDPATILVGERAVPLANFLEEGRRYLDDLTTGVGGKAIPWHANAAFYAVDLRLVLARLFGFDEGGGDLVQKLKSVPPDRWTRVLQETGDKILTTRPMAKGVANELGSETNTGFVTEQAVQDFLVNQLPLLIDAGGRVPEVAFRSIGRREFIAYKGTPQKPLTAAGETNADARGNFYDLAGAMEAYSARLTELARAGVRIDLGADGEVVGLAPSDFPEVQKANQRGDRPRHSVNGDAVAPSQMKSDANTAASVLRHSVDAMDHALRTIESLRWVPGDASADKKFDAVVDANIARLHQAAVDVLHRLETMPLSSPLYNTMTGPFEEDAPGDVLHPVLRLKAAAVGLQFMPYRNFSPGRRETLESTLRQMRSDLDRLSGVAREMAQLAESPEINIREGVLQWKGTSHLLSYVPLRPDDGIPGRETPVPPAPPTGGRGSEGGFARVPLLIGLGSMALAAVLTFGLAAYLDGSGWVGLAEIWANQKVAVLYGISTLGLIFGGAGWMWYLFAGGRHFAQPKSPATIPLAAPEFPVRPIARPVPNEEPLNAAASWLGPQIADLGRRPSADVSVSAVLPPLTALFGVLNHSLGRSVLPAADAGTQFLNALTERLPETRGRALIETTVQERWLAFHPPVFLPTPRDQKTTVFYLDTGATDDLIGRVEQAVVDAAASKGSDRVVVLAEPIVRGRLPEELAARPLSRRVALYTLAVDGADGLGPVENGVRSLRLGAVANRFGLNLEDTVVVAPAASLAPIVFPGNVSNPYVNRYVGDGVAVPVSTRFTATLKGLLDAPAAVHAPATRQGGFARASLLAVVASVAGTAAAIAAGTASPVILAAAALPGVLALGLEVRRSAAVGNLIQGVSLYGRLGALPDGRPRAAFLESARRIFVGRQSGAASTELLVWLAGGALFAAGSFVLGLAPTFFLTGYGLTFFSGHPTMSGRTLSIALMAAGAALFGLPTGAEAAGFFGIPGVGGSSLVPWLFGLGGLVAGVVARGTGGASAETARARESLKAVDALLPIERFSDILPEQWTRENPEDKTDPQAGLVRLYAAFGGAWLGFAAKAYDALSPAERSKIDVAFLSDKDLRRLISTFNALSRNKPEDAKSGFGVYAMNALRALAKNSTARTPTPNASAVRALALFLLAQRAELFGASLTEREANAMAILVRRATFPAPAVHREMDVQSSHWDLVPRPSGSTPDIATIEVDAQDDAGLVRSLLSSLQNGAVILAVSSDPDAAAQRLARAKDAILREQKPGVLETLRRPDHRHALDSWQDLTRRVVSRTTPGILDEQGRYSVAGLYKAVPELSKTMGFAPGLFSGESIKYRLSILTGDKTLAHWNQVGVPEIGELVQFLILEGPKIVRMSLSITQEMEAIHVLSTNA